MTPKFSPIQPSLMRRSPLGPPPPASSLATHNVMVSNRGRNTGLELKLRQALWAAGIRGFRVGYLVGRTNVDVAFPARRVAVLVNGCFWHHCPVCDYPVPMTHSRFWEKKFALTRLRDARVRHSLNLMGWRLVELWEHQIRDDPDRCVRRVVGALAKAVVS